MKNRGQELPTNFRRREIIGVVSTKLYTLGENANAEKPCQASRRVTCTLSFEVMSKSDLICCKLGNATGFGTSSMTFDKCMVEMCWERSSTVRRQTAKA